MTGFMDLSLTTNNHDFETFIVSLILFKDYQHKQREKLERKTRLNSADFYNFDT